VDALGRSRAVESAAVVGRRDAIDAARVLALLVVVLGHLVIAVIDRPEGDVRGANLLALYPGWAWLAAFAPMPIFFASAGWANATSTLTGATARLRTLVGLAAVLVGGWAAAVVVATTVTGEAGVVGDGARIATQPLWFLAAYLPFAAAGRRLGMVAAGHGGAIIGTSLLLLAVLDVARFEFGAPGWIGWPGFFLAWGTMWIAGAWWRARAADERFDERRTGLVIAVTGALGCVALVVFVGYQPALIDAVADARSNTTPPTLYTAVVGLAQIGFLLLAGRLLDGAWRRGRQLWDRAAATAVGIYIWHLTALALCAAAIAGGAPAPTRLTPLWWATRPLWWASVLSVTVVFVAFTAGVTKRRPRHHGASLPGTWRVLAGVAIGAAGAGLVGIEGPRTVPIAVLCAVSFTEAWWLLRSSSRAGHSPGTGPLAEPDPAGTFGPSASAA
jgi:hypothetical protein